MSPTALTGATVAVAVVAVSAVIASAGSVAAERTTRRRVRALAATVEAGPRPPSPTDRLVGSVRSLVARVADLAGRGDRARRRADRHLPVLLEHVTRQLRSGASLVTAVHSAASGSDDVSTGRMATELGSGASLATTVDDWQQACPSPARGLVAAALTMASEAGGSVAVVLDGVSDTLRDRIAIDREVAALSSQARASAAVLVVAPLGFAGLAGGADHRVADVLIRQPLGWACVAVGLLLDGVGAVWMSRLASRSR